jgi:hypothetical protein
MASTMCWPLTLISLISADMVCSFKLVVGVRGVVAAMRVLYQMR